MFVFPLGAGGGFSDEMKPLAFGRGGGPGGGGGGRVGGGGGGGGGWVFLLSRIIGEDCGGGGGGDGASWGDCGRFCLGVNDVETDGVCDSVFTWWSSWTTKLGDWHGCGISGLKSLDLWTIISILFSSSSCSKLGLSILFWNPVIKGLLSVSTT